MKTDEDWIRQCLSLAQSARERGDHPFGALLLSPEGECLLEAQNTVESQRDITGHAELNLMRLASHNYSADYLAQCTLYSSTEPCPMCAGAIFWGNVRKVVFGLSEAGLYEVIGLSEAGLYEVIGQDSEEVLSLPCRQLFAFGAKAIEVIGPILSEEAAKVHQGFW